MATDAAPGGVSRDAPRDDHGSSLPQRATVNIRPYRPADRDVLYRVCVRTGDGGSDATDLYRDPAMLGDVFVGPYLELQPRFAFVVDDGSGPEGYVLGALDTATFAADCERHWWPALRERYRDVDAIPGSREEWLLRWITTPPAVPAFTDRYPSHLHIDLLPQRQSGGWGRRMMDRLLAELSAAGSVGVHLGVGRANSRAVGFYRHLGFTELDADDVTVWLGLSFS